MVSGRNYNDADASFLVFHFIHYDITERNYIVSGVDFEAIVPAIKNNFFYKRIIGFFNIL